MSVPAEKKAATEKMMVIGLLAVFGLTLLRGPVMKMLRPAAGAVAVGSAGQIPLIPAAASSQPSHTEAAPAAKKTYTASELRDPFESRLPVPPQPESAVADASSQEGMTETSAPQPQLEVEGILWGGSRPKAVINGDVYGINDIVEGVKIVAIDHRGVAVDLGGQPVYYAPSTGNESVSPY